MNCENKGEMVLSPGIGPGNIVIKTPEDLAKQGFVFSPNAVDKIWGEGASIRYRQVLDAQIRSTSGGSISF